MILLTGANGFVGKAVAARIPAAELKLLVRRASDIECASEVLCDLVDFPELSSALGDVTCVIHCAARAHVMNEGPDAIEIYREVNVTATLHLARAAAEAGVRRFVYLSSVKVHGESTTNREPFSSASGYAPVDPYGVSKVEAEQALRELCNDYPMELVIIRPPLVYGPGVKANFRSLMNLAAKNLPLPLGSAKRLRSLVYIENLVDVILVCSHYPAAAGKSFLVSDGRDVTTAELLRQMTGALGKRPRLFKFPPVLLRFACKIIGREGIYDRLFGSLQIDIQHTCDTLDWQPPVPFEVAIAKTMASLNKSG